jgi:hypothetical protein
MDHKKQARPPKKLDGAFSGIRSGFGLFRRVAEPAAMTQDQEMFLRRLEEVLDLESKPARYAPEPLGTFTSTATDAAQSATPLVASAPVMEHAPVIESAPLNQAGETAEPSAALPAWPDSEWRNIVQAVRSGSAFGTEHAATA